MNEIEAPAVALPLTDPESESQNTGFEQENHQDPPLPNPSLQNDNSVQVKKGNIALNDQSDVARSGIKAMS